jgi:glycosyltransferase involved in cell wall biosynthesis
VDIKYFRAASSRISAAKRKAYRRKHEVPARAKVVLAVAKLNRREAPWDLIKALPHLGSKVQLWVAGDGPVMRKLELETKTERHRVKLLGYIQYPELPALYAAADLFVHTAREEHWGVSIGEAMACDLPVIASSGVGAGDDLIKPGINGHVYPAGKPKRLAHFIEKALKLGPGDVKDANRKILADWEYLAAWKELTKATKKARDWVNRERR